MAWNRKKRLELLPDSQAPADVAEIYSDIRRRLGLSITPTYFQALAIDPAFLRLHWQALCPVVRTKSFWDNAERVRAEAYTALHNYFNIPDFCRNLAEEALPVSSRKELSEVVDHLCSRKAATLLISALQAQAFEGSALHNPSPTLLTTEPPKAPDGQLTLVPEQSVSANTRHVFDEIRRALDLPLLTSDYYALARWPEFLDALWKALRPHIRSFLYSEHRLAIRESAMQSAATMPVLSSLSSQALEDVGIDATRVSTLVHINEVFADVMAANLVAITFAHIALEGGNGRDYDITRVA
ncbi:MAG: hypothetical protein JOZ43_08215 [Acidobacteriales bacterium]|nr:hypothetical protein [Terriglobales bacterium]